MPKACRTPFFSREVPADEPQGFYIPRTDILVVDLRNKSIEQHGHRSILRKVIWKARYNFALKAVKQYKVVAIVPIRKRDEETLYHINLIEASVEVLEKHNHTSFNKIIESVKSLFG